MDQPPSTPPPALTERLLRILSTAGALALAVPLVVGGGWALRSGAPGIYLTGGMILLAGAWGLHFGSVMGVWLVLAFNTLMIAVLATGVELQGRAASTPLWAGCILLLVVSTYAAAKARRCVGQGWRLASLVATMAGLASAIMLAMRLKGS